MALSRRYLNDDERVVVSTRTHVKALLVPLLVLVVALGLAIWLSVLAGHRAGGALALAVWALFLGVLVCLVLPPVLRWLTSTYTFTDRRLITRSGILSRQGRTIPLNRISGVDFEMGVLDRMLGCGTLVVSDASTNGRVSLPDIPQVERVQLRVAEELDALGRRERPHHHDDGS